MEFKNIPKEHQENITALRYNSVTIEADVNQAIDEAENWKDAQESIKSFMKNLINETTGVLELLTSDENLRHIYVTTATQDGERCYHTNSIFIVNKDEFEKYEKDESNRELLRLYYDYDDKTANWENEALWIHGNEALVKIYSWREITKEEFNVLRKFI